MIRLIKSGLNKYDLTIYYPGNKTPRVICVRRFYNSDSMLFCIPTDLKGNKGYQNFLISQINFQDNDIDNGAEPYTITNYGKDTSN